MVPASLGLWLPRSHPCLHPHGLLLSGCRCLSSSYKDTVILGQGPALFQGDLILADSICSDPISKGGHTHRYRGLGLGSISGGHDSTLTPTIAERFQSATFQHFLTFQKTCNRRTKQHCWAVGTRHRSTGPGGQRAGSEPHQHTRRGLDAGSSMTRE